MEQSYDHPHDHHRNHVRRNPLKQRHLFSTDNPRGATLTAQSTAQRTRADYDVVVVGAGFSGLYTVLHLRGLGLRVCGFESGSDVGGTWYWNCYPGARVDIESLEYSYSFSEDLQQAWNWSERYASQAEVLRYLNHVADKFELRKNYRFNTHVSSAHYEEDSATWTITTTSGEIVRTTFCAMSVGLLSARHLPDIPGRDTFSGELYHTGSWPRDGVQFGGRRVGIIGTGASGVQMTPIIAREAEHLTVFQRSPHWCVPLQNVPMPPHYIADIKASYAELRARELEAFGGYTLVDFQIAAPNTLTAAEVSPEERQREYEYRWNSGGLSYYTSYTDLLFDDAANETLRDFFATKIRGIVDDPGVAATLVPTDHPILTKRLCGESGYYEAFNRPNVSLVDVRRDPIAAVTPTGVRLGSGKEYALDVIACATGYDAATGPLVRFDIRGRGGRSLEEHWSRGVLTHVGLMSHGFPNLFIVNGPQSVAAFFQPVLLAEYQADWIGRAIEMLSEMNAEVIEPTPDAETSWAAHVNDVAAQTLMPKANSWYMGANIAGKPRESLYYLGGFPEYRRRCELALGGDAAEFVLTDKPNVGAQDIAAGLVN
jgi:cyclohexanone monooxygenase